MRGINWLGVLAGAVVAAVCVPPAQAGPTEGELLTVVESLGRGVESTVDTVANSVGQGHVELDTLERDMIAVVNAERAAAGARPLATWSKLTSAADYHTREMLRGDYFDHDSLNGWTFAERLRKLAGARTAGEVMAYSFLLEGKDVSPRAIMDIWMASRAHRDQILKRTYNRIGVSRRIGRFKGSSSVVYTVDFARRR